MIKCWQCGSRFKKRVGYKDQWQDDGYGICHKCQKKNAKTVNDFYFDTEKLLLSKLNQDWLDAHKRMCNKHWAHKTRAMLVNRALDKKIVKRTI